MRARVLHDKIAHYAVRIGLATLHLFRTDDKTEIARAAFDAAQPAVTARVEIDLARAGRDACVLKMRFEGHEFWFLFVRVV